MDLAKETIELRRGESCLQKVPFFKGSHATMNIYVTGA